MNANMNIVNALARQPLPDIVIGQSISSRKVTVGTDATLLIDNNQYTRSYTLRITNSETDLFIGGPGVSTMSGFAVPSNIILTFNMLENTRLYGVGLIPIDVYILDPGI